MNRFHRTKEKEKKLVNNENKKVGQLEIDLKVGKSALLDQIWLVKVKISLGNTKSLNESDSFFFRVTQSV